MKKVKGYRCIICDAEFKLNEIEYVCNNCDGNLQITYDYQFIKENLKKSDFDFTISGILSGPGLVWPDMT